MRKSKADFLARVVSERQIHDLAALEPTIAETFVFPTLEVYWRIHDVALWLLL